MNKHSTTYRRARETRGLGMDEAAARLELGSDVLAPIEAGASQPDAVAVRHMALLYGVSADWLLGLSAHEVPAEDSHRA